MKKKHVLFILLCITVTLLGVLSSYFLPEKYYFDAYTIVLDRYNEKGWIGSYSFAMLFYDKLHLNKLDFPIIALIQLPIVFLLIWKIGIPKIFTKPILRNVPIIISIIIFSVYLAMPSKEFINFLYIFLITRLLQSNKTVRLKIIGVFLMLVFFGFFYRTYFALIPVLALGLYLSSFIKVKRKLILNIVNGLFLACVMSLSYGIIKGEFMSESSREALNKTRKGRADSQTAIFSPIKTNNIVGESVGIFYGFFSVNIPLNGLKYFYKPQVLAFVLWQSLLFIYLALLYKTCLKNRYKYRHEQWVFHLLFAYFIIQGVFEPDLGSAVKHKLGVFPLIWLAFYFNKGLIKRPKTEKKYVFKLVGLQQ